jgi:type IV pilus assembly protein PilW
VKAITVRPRKRIAGITLVELMVALAIGSFLMIGAVTVFMQSRTTFRISEAVARLQENGRFVLDAIEPNIRMSHYWGLTSRTGKIQGRATPADPVPPGLAVGGQNCGNNWAINLNEEVGGTNNAYGWACAANGGAQANADTLVVRRVSEDPVVPQAGTMYVQSARFQDGQIFVGAVVPPGFLPAPLSQTHQLMVDGYYVSPTSTLSTPGNNVPSLRVKTLIGGAGGPSIQDQEVLPGVEDMQVQFGVDTDLDGAVNRGTIDRYVNAGDPIITPGNPAFLPDAQILAVRIWLRLRAERPENGFTDVTNYVYADQNVAAPNDSFRRSIVSKTIYLRNARTPT